MKLPQYFPDHDFADPGHDKGRAALHAAARFAFTEGISPTSIVRDGNSYLIKADDGRVAGIGWE